MSTNDFKIKYLEDLKAKTEKKLKALKEKIYASPAIEILELHKQANEICERNGKDFARTSKELDPLISKDKSLRKLLEWQSKNSIKAMEEQIELERVISDIDSELYYLNVRKNRRVI